jgi:alkanesulfonate monooxygenase SsuD/methylene tetrahydromethanopterin reductase-like flavin-dependent oxidoreductase (luciferase family)
LKYGFVIPGGDLWTQIEVAREIEDAGWDGVFVADSVYGLDPWVTLAGMAMRTERVRLGTLLTPVSRRRPWKLASEMATLDQLSNGRVVISAGMGAIDTGFDKVGEVTDRKVRGQLLDEGLDLLPRFWSSQPFHYHGEHYHVDWDPTFWKCEPVQSPRIPIWVVGAWPRMKSVRRALRWDGLIVAKMDAKGSYEDVTAEDIKTIKAFADENREETTPFDIIMEGVTPGDDHARVTAQLQPYEEAGLTWWIESMWESPGGMEAVRARIKQGVPR